MSDREELQALRRMAELEAKASGVDAREAAASTARNTGTGEALMVAAGRSANQLKEGIKQVAFSGARWLTEGIGSPKSSAERAQDARQAEEGVIYDALSKEHPFTTAMGEQLPYVAVPASIGVLPASGVVGATEALKYGTPDERLGRGLFAAGTQAVGGMMANKMAGLINPVSGKAATDSRQAALQAAERVGVRPRLSEVTGNQTIARIEDMASRAPGGTGVMDDFSTSNAQAMNRAALRAIGENANELTPAILAQARDRIVKPFNDIRALPGRPIAINRQVGTVADDIIRQSDKMIEGQADQNLVALARRARALAMNNGRIDGEAYQLTRSGLSEASFDATGTNKHLYRRLLDALDDSAEQSLRAQGNGQLAEALRVSRPQYANLMTLEKGTTIQGGNVSPARVASTLRTNNPAAFREGRISGEMGDIATIGENLPPLRQGSQTFEREAVSNPLSMAVNAAWAWPLAKLTTSPMMTAWPRMAGGNTVARPIARASEEVAKPVGRAAIAAAMARFGLVPAPVVAENQ